MKLESKKEPEPKIKPAPACNCSCAQCDLGAHCGNRAKGCEWPRWGEAADN